MAKARSPDFKTELCRVSFAQSLFKARSQNDDGSKPKFGCTLIFPKTCNRASLEGALKQVIIDEWGEKGLERAKAGLIKSPFLDGAGKEARNKKTGELHPGFGLDVFFIRVQSLNQPAVFDKMTPGTEATVYSGCYGKAVINAFSWHDDRNGDGVSFGIQMFQKLQDGERIGGSGGVDPEKWLEAVADEGPAPESTKTGTGAGGLFGNM